MRQVDALCIDYSCRFGVLRNRPDGDYGDEVAPLVSSHSDPIDDVVGEGAIEGVLIVFDADVEVWVWVFCDPFAIDLSSRYTRLHVAEGKET
jgi:hypothetical protein